MIELVCATKYHCVLSNDIDGPIVFRSRFSQATGGDRSDALLRGRAEHHRERRDPLAGDLRYRAECEDGRDLSRDFPRQRPGSGAEVRQTIDRRSAGACAQRSVFAIL